MSDDKFDDGLVHRHIWAANPRPVPPVIHPVADASQARTPSTVHQDEHILPG